MKKNDSSNGQATLQNVKKQINHLAGFMFQQLSDKASEDNFVFSPLSAYILLSMAADAASGKTKKEITDLLSSGTEFNQTLEYLKYFQNQLTDSDVCSLANAVIVRDDIYHTIVPEYEKHLSELFNGKLFSTDDLAIHADAWVRQITKGKIPSMIDDSMREVLLCMINSSTFTAEWEEQYEDKAIQNENFVNQDRTVSRVKMLRSYEPIYIENEMFTGFVKPYKGNEFSYVILLPKKKRRPIGNYDIELDFSELLTGVDNTFARVLMPEFECSTDIDMTNTLEKIGIRTIFTPQADFSPMLSEWVKVSSLKHKAHIEVDRNGTKAAAYTFADFVCGAAPQRFPEEKEVFVNRPFLYAVVHNATGIPVFVGAVKHLDNQIRTGELDVFEEKERICGSIYQKICDMILDEDGVIKENIERKWYVRANVANAHLDIHELEKIEAEVSKL